MQFGNLVLILSALLGTLFSGSAFAEKKSLTWVLAHEPVAVFERAAKAFAEDVLRGTKGEVEIKVVTATEHYGKMVEPAVIIHELQEGKIQMTQTYTTDLGFYAKNLWALDLPYLFRDHDHATKVLDGAIGKELMADLSASGMTGLAFTYSGGFRILPATQKAVRSPKELQGLRIRVSRSPVAEKMFTRLGAHPLPTSLEDGVKGMISGYIDAGESTYPRYLALGTHKAAKWLNDTGHSLFLTGIVVHKKTFDSLSEAHRKVIETAALRAAGLERKQSIADGLEAKKKAAQYGVKVVELTKQERKAFQKATSAVYAEFPEYGALVERIRAVR